MKPLDLVQSSIRGVHFETHCVVFSSAQTLESLNKLAAGVCQVEGATAWWLGDIGLEIYRDKVGEWLTANPLPAENPEAFRAQRDQDAQEFAEDYLRARSEIVGCKDGYWQNCMALARFYPADQRVGTLTVDHHRAAMVGAGGQELHASTEARRKAQEWLFKADSEGWTASELRRQVNLALATHTEPKGPPEQIPFEPLDEADKWAMKNREVKLDQVSASKLLTRFQALIEFLERLKKIASS